MNKYNVYYFFKNINKKFNDRFCNIKPIIEEIYSFMQEDKSYGYLDSFKDLENMIKPERNSSTIDRDKVEEYVNRLIDDIENEDRNEFKDYSYIEEKIRNIVFSIK